MAHVRDVAGSHFVQSTVCLRILYCKTHASFCAEYWQHHLAPLPFELQVLEVVLGDVASMASQLARDLEAVVHPALDSLMKSVSNPSNVIMILFA